MANPPSRLLLDKGVVRRVYEARARRLWGRQLTAQQQEALDAFAHLLNLSCQLFITAESANVLRLRPPRYTRLILRQTQPLRKARYLRRWARRLKSFAFSPEDAVVLAYASFGITASKQHPGINALVTTDLGLINNFKAQRAKIELRFERMISKLPAPYTNLRLPVVMTTANALALT